MMWRETRRSIANFLLSAINFLFSKNGKTPVSEAKSSQPTELEESPSRPEEEEAPKTPVKKKRRMDDSILVAPRKKRLREKTPFRRPLWDTPLKYNEYCG